MVLGDNIFFGHGLPGLLEDANAQSVGGTVFGYHVTDPERYGVVDIDDDGRAQAIIEKLVEAPSNYAVIAVVGSIATRLPGWTPSASGTAYARLW